ncbi:MAG: hypothetical protein ACRDH5_13115 [bacterium]
MPAAHRQPRPVLRVVLVWLALTFLTGWLPLVRGAFDGPSYEWGTSYFGVGFSGAGMSGDYWLSAVKTALGLAILWLGWRGARPLFLLLALAWQSFGLADALYSSLTHPEEYRFQGATLGVDVSLAWVAPAAYAVFLLLTLVWAFRHARADWRQPLPPWTRRNTVWLLGLAALLPVQFALLRFGGPTSTADQVGVVFTILQWFLVGKALAPAPASASARS